MAWVLTVAVAVALLLAGVLVEKLRRGLREIRYLRDVLRDAAEEKENAGPSDACGGRGGGLQRLV